MTPEEATAAMLHVRGAVAAGFLAFPVKLVAGQKKPAREGWQRTVWDLGMLEQALQEPKCFGYGLTLPKDDPRRLVDLDLDDGGEGLQPGQAPWQERLVAVENEYGALPKTKTTETPSGGEHRWFLWPGNVPLPGGSWNGFTVRTLHGAKNFVVGPGSIRDGKPYVNSAPGTPLATMPDRLAASGTKAKTNGAGLIEIRAPYQLPESVDHGECHLEVCRYTLSLWDRRLSLEEMWTLVLVELGPRLATRHTEEHLRQHFDSATAELPAKYPRDEAGYVVQPAGPSAGPLIVGIDAYRAAVPVDIPWRCRMVAYAGGVTLIAGPPKAGKSTLAAQLQRCRETGEPFLGAWQVTVGPALLVTEEGGVAVVYKTTGLHALDVLDRRAAAGLTFVRVLGVIGVWGAENPDGLVFIDTLAIWAGIENENDASEATKAVAAVTALAQSTGLAIALVHHARKSGGDNGEAIRGSGAILATVDIAIELSRVDAMSDDRWLDIQGRVIMPERFRLAFDRLTQSYALGDRAEVNLEEIEADLVGIPADGPGLTRNDLNGLWKKDPRARLEQLLNVGRLRSEFVHVGRVWAYRYWSVPAVWTPSGD